MPDVVDVIMADHRMIDRLIADVPEHPVRERAISELADVISAHCRAEEWAVYPRLGRRVGTSESVEQALARHRETADLVDELLGCDPTATDVAEVLEDLRDNMAMHAESEEATLLPEINSRIESAERKELAQAFLAARARHLDLLTRPAFFPRRA
ncbi:MAG: hemerythrin domain-containing protein [Micropruina sp.]